MKFIWSFRYALRGIAYCIKNERNMRIHTVVALYVLVFSVFFELTAGEYALLFVTFSTVMAAEMFNTASEELADLSSANYNNLARIAKDVAAGGVLISAIFAVAVGVCLFWQPAAFVRMWSYFWDKPYLFFVLVVSIILALFYIILGPLGICHLFRRCRYQREKEKKIERQ